jgi:hypothetical protein
MALRKDYHGPLLLPILSVHGAEERTVSCSIAGDKVLYGKFDGMTVEYNSLKHVLIRDDDVLLTWQGPELTVDAAHTIRDR